MTWNGMTGSWMSDEELAEEIAGVLREGAERDAHALDTMTELYPYLAEQRRWIRGRLLSKTQGDESLADEATEETLNKSFHEIHFSGGMFRPTPAWLSKVSDNFFINSQRARRKLVYAHQLPKSKDKNGEKLDVIEAAEVEAVKSNREFPCMSPPGDVEKRLVSEAQTSEIRERYLAALGRLPPVQCAAWILCKDEFLTPEEAERLLIPALGHWRTARAALRAKPVSDAEASRLLCRKDVSPDVRKAKVRLAEELSDLSKP